MAQMAGPKLRYRWQGTPLVYQVSVEIDRGDVIESHQGRCFVNAQKSNQANNPLDVERRGTGTGFVVQSNGTLITCHHVIEGASKIEVSIGGRTYPGTVVAVDETHDLAIVKIQANNLPTLALGDSDRAQVGEEVRALGYPLASVLGDNIKATRGTISGINAQGGRRSFQLDAAINPGNSGGPLVAETGQVIGVNNSKLSGEAVSGVGFAAPSNEVKRLLQRNNLAFQTTGWDVKLDGPTLVRRVAEATALISVTLGPDREAQFFRVTCNSSLARSERLKPGAGVRPFGPPRLPSFSGIPVPSTIEMDWVGHVRQHSGGSQLPLLLGDVGLFLIHELPEDNREAWETTGGCTIEESADERPFGMFSPRIPRGPFGPGGLRQNTRQRQATERSRYSRSASVGDVVTLTRRYELKVDAAGNAPGLHLTGEGQIPFDVKNGYPRGATFNGSLTIQSGNTQTKVPIQVSYTLLEGEEREKALNPPKPPPPKPTTEADLPGLLADARSSDFARNLAALEKLAAMKPVPTRRDEVVKTLIELLEEKNSFVRKTALKALGTWSEPNSTLIDALTKLVDDEDVFTRKEAIETLGNLKAEQAIEPIAKRLIDPLCRGEAVKALKAIGPKAEKAVLPILESKDIFVVMEACNLLKEIGTNESRAPLEKLSKDRHPSVARHARTALEEIAKRK